MAVATHALSLLAASTRPVLEKLEERRLLAASLDGGVLTVTGTANADSITVGLNSAATKYSVNINGKAQSFNVTAVKKLIVNGEAGNDKIRFNEKNGRLTVSPYINGGDGNDRITGSTRKDKVRGGRGRDFILGGKGNDRLSGESDADTVFGDAGNDVIYGGGGHDILGGDDEGALVIVGKKAPRQISGNDKLDGGSGDDWLLGGTRYERGPDEEGNANSVILFDDDDTDTMTGGAGADVMGAYLSDDVFTDRNASEDDVPSIDRRAPSPHSAVHLHAQLNIRIRQSDGSFAKAVVPYAIGGTPTQAGLTDLDAVHTHGMSGRIHLESTDGQPFFMYEVFENWGISVNHRMFGRALAAKSSPITYKVTHENGQTENIRNLNDYQIADEDVITVTIG